MESASLTYAALSDVGKKRDHNEDSYLVDEELGLFVVCDGMGGHAAGEVASAIAVKTMQEEIRSESDVLKDYVAGKQGASKVSKKEILNMLEFAANRASQRIYQAAQADANKRGMGTTLVAILFVGSQAFVVHVGDSRLYQLRGDKVEQLTVDHNVYNELIKRKKMTREQVMQLAPKNAITRAVGVYESCEPESFAIDVVPGDRFLLCSDGLSEYFEEPQGTPVELGKQLAAQDLNQSAKTLIDTANQRGGKDNITAVLVALSGGGVTAVEDKLHEIEHKKTVLAQMSLFRQLDDVELRRVLQVTETNTYSDGQHIITEGQRGESLYIVLSGTVRVLRGEVQVKTLTVGDNFGEMALIRNQPRSASVISIGTSEMLVMHRAEFFEILRSQPRIAVKLLWQFTGVLADRLAETTRDLGEAREGFIEEVEPEDITEELFTTDLIDDDDRLTNKLPPPPSEEVPVSTE